MNIQQSNSETILLKAKTIFQELEQIKDNFSFLADLKIGENLQPTTRGRTFTRYLAGQKENFLQKTVDWNIGLYAYASDAYGDGSFKGVYTHLKQEITKAEQVFTEALELYNELLDSDAFVKERLNLVKSAKEAFLCMGRSRIGLFNWQVTLTKKIADSSILNCRIKKINKLILKKTRMLDLVFKRCVESFPNATRQIEEKELASGGFNGQEAVKNNTRIICRFAKGETPLLQADAHMTLMEVYETKILPAEWVHTWGEPHDELTRLIDAISWTLDMQHWKTSKVLEEAGHNLSLGNIVKLKDCIQEEMTLSDGLESMIADLERRYGQNEKDLLKKLSSIKDAFDLKVQKAGGSFEELVERCRLMRQNGIIAFDLSESVCSPHSDAHFTAEEATKRLDAYVARFGQGLSLEKARELIEEGKQLLRLILDGSIGSAEDCPRGAEEGIASLMWFLMQLALNKGQGHEEGAFVIEDHEDKLYHFLLKTKLTGDRPSSHFVGRSEPWGGLSNVLMSSSRHQGIDILNGLLPASKRHILFGKVDSPKFLTGEGAPPAQVLFIKLESFSPYTTTGYGYDMTMHGAELCIAQYNKKFKPGSDDLPEMAKERIPAALLQQFYQLINALEEKSKGSKELQEKLSGLDLNSAKKMAKIWGISYMRHFIELMKRSAIEIEGPNIAFEELDHRDRRTGREVYLTYSELK